MVTIPRQSRKLSESKTYHVMVRGNERKPIFLDNEDRTRFLDILYLKSIDKKWLIYAYCLMNNHVHLLINEGNDNIGRIMKRINVSYAFYFNKKYHRVGHLFQDRFKSEVIDKDSYLLSAARYIHNNPVKAGLSTGPENYSWSSYNLYTDHSKPKATLVDTDLLLGMYSDNTVKARKFLAEYTNNVSDDEFIEYNEILPKEVSIRTCIEAEKFIQSFIIGKLNNVEDLQSKENKELRNTLICELKRHSCLSIRELANMLRLDRNIVQRVR